MRKFVQIGLDIARFVQTLQARWEKPLTFALRWAVPILLLGYLGYRLTQLGWIRIWQARPGAFSFYIILFLLYFTQPFTDLVIYRRLWNAGRALPLSILLRKRYLNSSVLGYSGEAYFFFWAQRVLKLEKSDLLHALKDTNVLSAGAGLVMVWLVLLALLATGGLRLPAVLSSHVWTLVSGACLPLVLCLVLVIGGRRVTSLRRSQIGFIFAIHLARCMAEQALRFALWWVSGALPSAVVCLQFVALQLLVSRLPLLPNKDLLFVGVGIATAGFMDLSAPAIAAVLVITTAFDSVLEFILVGLPWLFDRSSFRHEADPAAT